MQPFDLLQFLLLLWHHKLPFNIDLLITITLLLLLISLEQKAFVLQPILDLLFLYQKCHHLLDRSFPCFAFAFAEPVGNKRLLCLVHKRDLLMALVVLYLNRFRFCRLCIKRNLFVDIEGRLGLRVLKPKLEIAEIAVGPFV